MVDDIEKVNLYEWDPHLTKFEYWNLWEEDLWEYHRDLYTNKKIDLCFDLFKSPIYEVDSLCVDDEIGEHRDKVYKNMVSFHLCLRLILNLNLFDNRCPTIISNRVLIQK